MFIDRSQIFRSAEPVDTRARPLAMPPAAQGIHRLGRDIVGQAVLPRIDAAATGISAAALVETASGWCHAADLRRGTLVHTLDGGLRPLADVAVQTVWPSGDGCAPLVHLPGGTLGTCDDLWLMPEQPVLIGGPIIHDVLGLPRVMLVAGRLAGLWGCTLRHPPAAQALVTLRFSQAEAIWVNSGLLLACDGSGRRAAPVAPLLDGDRAAALVGLLADGCRTSDVSAKVA